MCKCCDCCNEKLIGVGKHFRVRMKNTMDSAYSGTVFVCIASDSNMVVAKAISKVYDQDRIYLFDRTEYICLTVARQHSTRLGNV